MAEYIYETPEGWKIREGTDPNLVDPVQALLLEIYNRQANIIANGAGKQTLRNALMPITAGATDSIEFSAYANTIPVALLGKTSGGQYEIINPTNTAGYVITPANYYDQILLTNFNGNANSYAADFNFQQLLTGVGTSIAWTSGTYSEVVLAYIIPSTSSSTTIAGMVQFTTVDAQTDYTDSGLGTIGTVAFVKYGQSFLAEDQYSIAGITITINPGLPVEGGLQLLIVPFN